MNALEFLHWLATAHLVASAAATVLVSFLPPPTEIAWRPWVILFNTLQRLSVGPRRNWNGNGAAPPK